MTLEIELRAVAYKKKSISVLLQSQSKILNIFFVVNIYLFHIISSLKMYF